MPGIIEQGRGGGGAYRTGTRGLLALVIWPLVSQPPASATAAGDLDMLPSAPPRLPDLVPSVKSAANASCYASCYACVVIRFLFFSSRLEFSPSSALPRPTTETPPPPFKPHQPHRGLTPPPPHPHPLPPPSLRGPPPSGTGLCHVPLTDPSRPANDQCASEGGACLSLS